MLVLYGGNDDIEGLEGDTREIMQAITQQTRANLIQDMLGHPEGSPSMKEFEYMNPSKSTATIREHLDRLIEIGFVEKTELKEDINRDLPRTFYQLSDEGKKFLKKHEILIDEQEQIQREYANVEKSEQVKAAEEAPRPEGTA